MAAPNVRMRLIVEVLPLRAENAHGPHQAAAMAAFKGRKFALPAQSDHTFEQLWRQIEERYKRNYLDPMQAASFMIKKLQDAYDCDLDLGDTVGAIFEGENDNQMRMIKVVPSFINRDFSMPITSNLRPTSAPKRNREISEERTSKRRRLEGEQRELMDLDPVRDRPLASTESGRIGELDMEGTSAWTQTGRDRSRRSKTGNSLVFVENTQTGNQEFSTQVKEESPELGLPPSRTIPESPGLLFKKPLLPASRLPPAARQHTRSPARTPRRPSNGIRLQQFTDEDHDEQGIIEHADMGSEDAQVSLDPTPAPHEDLQEAAIQESPKSTPEQVETVASQVASARKRVYRTPSSPPFMKPRSKPPTTYSRSPGIIVRDTSLLNSSRPRSMSAQGKPSGQSSAQQLRGSKAHLFQVATTDEIESTPQQDISSASGRDIRAEDADATMKEVEGFATGTPALGRSVATKPKKAGSLNKPKQLAYTMPHTPKTTIGRTDPEARSKNNSTSASTNSGGASRVSPNVRAGTVSLLRRSIRDTSPKVLIPKKAIPMSPGLRVQATSGAQETLGLDSHRAINGILSRPSPVNGTGDSSELTKPVQKDPTSLLVKEHAGPRRTPVPLPENVRHFQKPDISQSREEDFQKSQKSADLAQPAREAKAKGRPKKTMDVDEDVELPVNGDMPMVNEDIPLEVSEQLQVPGDSTSERRPREAKNSKRTARKTDVPLPNNIRNLEEPAKAIKSNSEASAVTTTPVPPQKRGRLRKNASAIPVSTAPVPTKRRGRPPKDASAAPISTGEKGSTSQKSAKAATNKSAPVPRMASGKAEDAIILSSGGSSSDDSDAEKGETEVAKAPIAKLKTPDQSEYPPVGQSTTASLTKKHTRVMDTIFPGGHEKARKRQDPTREVFGDLPKSPVARKAKKRPDVMGDMEASLGGNADLNGQPSSADLESRLQMAAAMDFIETSEPTEPRVLISEDLDDQHIVQKTATKSAPWNSNSWSFGAIDQQNGVLGQADVEMASRSRSNSPPGPELEGTTESESEPEAQDNTRSKSASAANSARSSPEMSRQPARFLSRSPTPKKSSSDEESETSRSRSHSRAASSKAANGDKDSDSDESSDNSDSDDASKESGSEDEGIELVDADKDIANAGPPSSPPEVPPQPVTLVPATQSSQLRGSSQPVHRRTSAPFSSNTPLAPATQPILNGFSRSTIVRAATPRSGYRFKTIREQLADMKANPAYAKQTKEFDTKTQSLGKLKKGKALPFGNDSSGDDSSSSSSSDEEDGKEKNGGSCSVA